MRILLELLHGLVYMCLRSQVYPKYGRLLLIPMNGLSLTAPENSK
jgi:hypothetical protein